MNHQAYELLVSIRARGFPAFTRWYEKASDHEIEQIVSVCVAHTNFLSVPELADALEDLYVFLLENGEL